MMLSETEMEKFEILLEVMDMSDFKTDKLVGSFSIGLATLYKSMDHQFHNQWLPLSNPNSFGNSEASVILCSNH